MMSMKQKYYTLQMTGYVTVFAESPSKALEHFEQWVSEGFPVAELNGKDTVLFSEHDLVDGKGEEK